MTRLIRSKFTKKFASLPTVQSLLRYLVSEFEYLQGIGAGAGIRKSGEIVIAKQLQHIDGHKTIFDVGANIGGFTEMADSFVFPATFHLFEPQKNLVNDLETKYLKDDRKMVNSFALSDASGEDTLYYDIMGSGLASLSKRNLDHFNISFEKSESVNVRTVDWYCEQHDINHIDLLKIDVEGYELNVLKGAKQMISSHSVDYISFEFGGANIDTRTYFQDYWYFFEEYGYNIYRILPSSDLSKIDRYREIDEKFRTTNYLAISPRASASL
ncbi:FkbM family methyltransferase [Haladaptatus sp. CMSO5]|uniref:FkbM family methyltransferase n=1 Tax=Haladaptatus sp. CMSO5 TaxID=3120514 RepID=UPI002FCE0A09